MKPPIKLLLGHPDKQLNFMIYMGKTHFHLDWRVYAVPPSPPQCDIRTEKIKIDSKKTTTK